MSKVRVENAQVGKWYKHPRHGRCLFASPAAGDFIAAFLVNDGREFKYFNEDQELTPLPDCDGWGWMPPAGFF